MKSAAIIAAAAFAVAGFSLAPARAASPAPAQATVKTANNASSSTALTSPDSEIEGAIAKATQYALTPKHMAKLVSLFPDAQRQSLAKSSTYSNDYGQKLDAQINSISKAWKQKYGDSFAITKAHDVLGQTFASIRTQSPGASSGAMESATVDLKGDNGAMKLDVPLVCDKGHDWKINVPTSMTAEKLRDNLQEQLAAVDKQSAHWPASENDAYRMVAHHVMAAILDKPMSSHAQASATAAPTANVARQTPAANVKPVSATSSHPWYEFWSNW